MQVKLLIDACLDLFLPPRCPVCNAYHATAAEHSICLDCRHRIEFVNEPVCAVCGMEVYAVGSSLTCGDCLKEPPPFERARSLFRYGDEVRALISCLKYKKDTSVTTALVQLAQECDLSLFQSCDYIVPVPLHKKRIQQRGFNQALLLAKICFGKNNNRIASDILRRTRNTVPQVSLGARQRRRSLKNVFTVNPLHDISGTAICLIDDVYTTGTTVSECTRALLAGGAGRVIVLTYARVSAPRRGRRGG